MSLNMRLMRLCVGYHILQWYTVMVDWTLHIAENGIIILKWELIWSNEYVISDSYAVIEFWLATCTNCVAEQRDTKTNKQTNK